MIRRLLFTFLVSQSLMSGLAWACSCIEPDHSQDAASFVGVARSTWMGCGGPAYQPYVTTFDVEDSCLGELGETVEVWHGIAGSSCGVEFVEGQRYVVYLLDRGNDQFGTGMCMGNAEVKSPECPSEF